MISQEKAAADAKAKYLDAMRKLLPVLVVRMALLPGIAEAL